MLREQSLVLTSRRETCSIDCNRLNENIWYDALKGKCNQTESCFRTKWIYRYLWRRILYSYCHIYRRSSAAGVCTMCVSSCQSIRVRLLLRIFFFALRQRLIDLTAAHILIYDCHSTWKINEENSGKKKFCYTIKRRCRATWRHIYSSTIQVSKRKQTQSLGREQSHARPST